MTPAEITRHRRISLRLVRRLAVLSRGCISNSRLRHTRRMLYRIPSNAYYDLTVYPELPWGHLLRSLEDRGFPVRLALIALAGVDKGA